MTAGQSAGQLRRANNSGMYVAITAVVAGALAIGILATLANAHPATVTPAAAPIPVPPYEFRLDEHAASNPVSIPVPPYDVRLQEHDLASTAAAAGSIVGTTLLDRAADNGSASSVVPQLLDRAADNGITVATGAATTSQEAKARAQMTAASGAAAPATKHVHGKNSNGYSRWGMNAQ